MGGDLLLMKGHFFFFFAALGPILPFVNVIAKQLGISEIAIGIIYAIIPGMFLIMKPLYGFVIDYYIEQRTCIFICTLAVMGLSFLLIYFIPPIPLQKVSPPENTTCLPTLFCDLHNIKLGDIGTQCNFSKVDYNIDCSYLNPISYVSMNILFKIPRFWGFVVLLSFGLCAFNIINSASDAICFIALGEGNEMKYGDQRLYGTIGYGLSALLAGYYIDHLSKGSSNKNNTPSFVLFIFFIFIDIIVCSRIKFTVTEKPKHIFSKVFAIFKKPNAIIFAIFTLISGILDGFTVYYLFWFLENIAVESGLYVKIRFIEGITVLAQCLGEVIMFRLIGKIVPKLGFENSMTISFIFYAIRLYSLSIIPNPWWVLPIELLFHGLTFVIAYYTIITYASVISPHHGIQGTMQGIMGGIFDGFGYAFGGLIGGVSSSYLNMRITFKIFSVISLFSAVVYYLVFILFIQKRELKNKGVISVEENLVSSDEE